MTGSSQSSKQKSKNFQFDFTDWEDALAGINMGIVQMQIEAMEQQFAFQQQALATMSPAMESMFNEQMAGLSAFTPEQLKEQLISQQGRVDQFNAAQDQLLQTELARIQRGGVATPEQRALINQTTEAQIARGQSDIDRFMRSNLDLITQELAPARGLRPSDTPIQDRAFKVGEEAQRQYGELVSDLRGQQALSELNFPLAADRQSAEFSQFQQGLAQSASNFQQQLAQQAFGNRLGLFNTTGQFGLGLMGGIQPASSLQQAFKPEVGTKSSGSSSGASGGFSAKALKADFEEIDANEILGLLESLPVERWRYLYPERGMTGKHIGPYAEDFADRFGIGDGKTINYLDAIGVLMASVKALAARVRELEGA